VGIQLDCSTTDHFSAPEIEDINKTNSQNKKRAMIDVLQGILDSNDEALGGATSFILGGHSMVRFPPSSPS